MSELSLPSLVWIVFVLSTGLLIKWWTTPASMLPYPPGPAPSPISGNFWGLPTKFPWLKYAEWAKQYGNLIHLKAFTNHIVVVNNVDDATALFEKRSRIYSNRPRSTMVELMGFDFSVAFIGYGDKWRRHRRIYHQTLNKAAVQRTQEPTQTLKVHDYLNQLVVAPDDFMAHFRNVTASIIMATVYDNKMAQSEIEKFTYISEVALTKLSGAFLPGTFIVDALSFLKYIPAWFPGANFKRYAAECRVLTDEMQRGPMKYVKERLAAGFEVSGLVATLLERKGDQDAYQKELDTREIAATIFAAGADTSVSALSTFIYAMVVNPVAQKRGQDEIDALIGSNRLPKFSDRPNLPYIEAIYREVMRWYPVAPLGLSHAALEDDAYNGYFIPKGTIVISNIWAMTHDETRYPQPDLFLPDRFLDEGGKLNDDDTVLAFGFGRRICPGRHMASSTVWLVIAATLATFNIQKAIDEQGNEIPVDEGYTDGLVCRKLPFRCSITLRSEGARKLILDPQSKRD